MKTSLIGAIALVLFLAACEEDELYTSPLVDEELYPYFQQFEEEAWARGLRVDLEVAGIEGRIRDIEDPQVAGQCFYNGDRPNTVIIDEGFWAGANHWIREFYVFHELGHCYLNRAHTDLAYPNGVCYSIMHSGTSGCYFQYNQDTRAWYMDELFDVQ